MSDGDDIPHLSEDSESVESDIVAEEVAQSGDEGDDLYNENFLQDYAPIPELDQYEYDDIVVEDVTERLPEEEEVAARKRAEEEMDARDRQLDYRKSTSSLVYLGDYCEHPQAILTLWMPTPDQTGGADWRPSRQETSTRQTTNSGTTSWLNSRTPSGL